MITSLKGQQMIKKITPMYANSSIEQSIYEAIGSEWDDIYKLVDELLLQVFPQTATWGLMFWEQRLGVATNLNEDIEKRRRNIIAKMQSRYTVTPERMAIILKNYTGADIQIIENIAPFIFETNLISKNGFPKGLEDLYKKVKKIKPSHLSVKYKLDSNLDSNLFVSGCMICGEEITIYPKEAKQ